MHKTTLEQWALLEKVIELGSFAKAAEETNRSQSSVSYNLALLQERLGVALLAPSGRRAVLTPAGELLLNQVKPLLKAFSWVETHAATLRNGARTRLDLVVDSIFPRQRLFAILRQFQQRYPQTQVRLTEVLENVDEASAARSEADVMVLTRRQDITGRGEWLMNIDFIAVAHRDHPLSQLEEPLDDNALAPWPLIRIADRSGDASSTRDAGPFLPLMPPLMRCCIRWDSAGCRKSGYAHTEQGVLKALPLSHGARRATPLHLIVKRDLAPLDEQVTTLLDLFRQS